MEKLAYYCYECNCSLTLEEFTSKEHADEHVMKWCNNEIATEKDMLELRVKNGICANTLKNIKQDPSRKRGNKIVAH